MFLGPVYNQLERYSWVSEREEGRRYSKRNGHLRPKHVYDLHRVQIFQISTGDTSTNEKTNLIGRAVEKRCLWLNSYFVSDV